MTYMKMLRRIIRLSYISLFICTISNTTAETKLSTIDQIIATVGDEIILKSEIEHEINRAKAENRVSFDGNIRSQIIESMLISKLLSSQAAIDSVVVGEDEVEKQLEGRMQQYLKYAGSKEKLEEYFKKTYGEIKQELRDATREMLVVDKMKNEIIKDVKVTPAEVRQAYREFPKDSLMLMPEKVMIEQVTRKPGVSQAEKDRIRSKLRQFRDDIYKGGSFATYAVLHSEDPGSAAKGGELGYMSRTELVPEFADVAFNLKAGKISKIVETEFGFHIIQLIDKKGGKVNVRHILLKPIIDNHFKMKARKELDSVRNELLANKLSFKEAARYFSDDKKTRNNGGLIMNPKTGGAFFEKTQLPSIISRYSQNMKENEISEVFFDTDERVPVYKFFKIKNKIAEHKANLNDDWSIFENIVLSKKKQEVLNEWIDEKIKDTYIELNENIAKEEFKHKWNR